MITNPNIQNPYTYDEAPRHPGRPDDYLGRYTVSTAVEVLMTPVAEPVQVPEMSQP